MHAIGASVTSHCDFLTEKKNETKRLNVDNTTREFNSGIDFKDIESKHTVWSVFLLLYQGANYIIVGERSLKNANSYCATREGNLWAIVPALF